MNRPSEVKECMIKIPLMSAIESYCGDIEYDTQNDVVKLLRATALKSKDSIASSVYVIN